MSQRPSGRRGAMAAMSGAGPGVPGRSSVGGTRGRGRARGGAAAAPTQPGGVEEKKISPPQRGSPPSEHSPPAEIDEKVRSLEEQMKDVQINNQTLASRPGSCSIGRVVPLSTNHFWIKFRQAENIIIERYSVEVKAKAGNRSKLNKDEKRYAFWKCVADNKSVFGNNYGVAYDGECLCYAINKLNFINGNGEQKFEFGVLMPNEDRPTTVIVGISYTGILYIDLKKVTDFQEKENSSIQAIDVIFRQGRLCPYVQSPFVPTVRSFYKENKPPINLGGGREIWSGYYSAGHVGLGWKPILNVDVTHTAFFTHQSVLGFLCDVMNKAVGHGGRDQWDQRRLRQTTMDGQQCGILQKQIKGLRITVKHLEEKRIYKVNGVTTGSASQLTFEAEGLGTISIADYFARRYQIQLQYPNLPCLWVGSRKKNINFPLELCEVRLGQKSGAKLDEEQTTLMIKFACKNAVERKRQIMDMVRTAQFHEDDWIKTFGLDFDPNMIKLNGRALPAPKMEYKGQRMFEVRNGVWNNAGDAPFYQPSHVKGYGLISLQPESNQAALETFCREIKKVSYKLGMTMPDFPHTVRYIRRPNDILPNLKQVQQGKDQTDFVLVALHARHMDAYSEVKRAAEIELGIMTQCVLPRTVRAPKPATISNLLNKINTKLGGINTQIAPTPQWTKMVKEVPTLVIGMDVTHPGPLDKKSPSVASMIGNIDLDFNRYNASVKVQRERREHIIHAQDMFRDRIIGFFKATNQKPQKIIIYRDGVSEGQFKHVLYEELGGVRAVCESLDKDYKPLITFVVVQKRHHTRFFCEESSDEVGKARNVPPGTLVDTEIVHPGYFDFFLVSHFGIQGTSRPTHYVVLHDDNNFTANQIQMFTYYLCHLYCRCARTVSIPAPVYYADLVCTRARSHLFDKISRMQEPSSGSGDGGTETQGEQSSVSEHELVQAVTLTTINEFNTTMYYV